MIEEVARSARNATNRAGCMAIILEERKRDAAASGGQCHGVLPLAFSSAFLARTVGIKDSAAIGVCARAE